MFESKDEEKPEEHEQTNAEYLAEKVDAVKDYTQEKVHATSDGIVNASSNTLEYIQAIPGETKKGAKNVQRKIGEF